MKDLSILIPARNEMFLARTIEDILSHIEADTEVIAVLDGEWAKPAIPQHERVNVIYVPQSIGQRAATNLACRLSKAKYVMKADAHCSFDQGFDRKMIEAFAVAGDNVTMVPTMKNLWAFDWKCVECGMKWYQGPTPKQCKETNFKKTGKPCTSTRFIRKMMWIGKERPQSNSYCFDSEPHFQYFNDYTRRPEYAKDLSETGLTETMSLQGSCWMLTRDKYWELSICDEKFGSWGSQGIEVAVKTWLSGGRVLVNHNTWYAHMFRTQGGDFGFPYPISNQDQEVAREYARNLFFDNNWDKQIHPLSWLIEKFWPVKGWTNEDLQKLKANTFQFVAKPTKQEPVESEPAIEVSKNDETIFENNTSVTEVPMNVWKSSYEENKFGELFYSLVRIYQPKRVVELGTKAGYSAYHFARALQENNAGTLDCYDLWENYQYKSVPITEAKNNLKEFANIVSFNQRDVVGVDEIYEQIDMLHVDMSNDGALLETILPRWIQKVNQLIIIEGGSKERDQVAWMNKYHKTPIAPWIKTFCTNHHLEYITIEPFPSVTLIKKT